jgi:hypothetical protein
VIWHENDFANFTRQLHPALRRANANLVKTRLFRHSDILLRDNYFNSMSVEHLSAKQQDIVLRCLKATAVHVDDWEKHSRLGLEADDLQKVIARWPHVDDRDEDGNDFLAINNCMNEICHGFSLESADWGNWFDTPMSEIESTYRSWLTLRRAPGGIR